MNLTISGHHLEVTFEGMSPASSTDHRHFDQVVDVILLWSNNMKEKTLANVPSAMSRQRPRFVCRKLHAASMPQLTT
jgi:hypothetical protein